jgi:hypothetical protein
MPEVDRLDYYDRTIRELTIERAMDGKKLYQLRKVDEPSLILLISQVLTHQLSQFNVKNTMNDEQIVTFVQEYVEKYSVNTVRDLMMCMKLASEGKFGQDYNRIDGPTLFRWLTLYDDRYREPALMDKNYVDKKEHESRSAEIVGGIKEGLEKRGMKMAEPEEKKKGKGGSFDDEVDRVKLYLDHYSDYQLEQLFDYWMRANYQYSRPTDDDIRNCAKVKYHVKDKEGNVNEVEAVMCQGPFDEMLAVIQEEIEKRAEIKWDEENG